MEEEVPMVSEKMVWEGWWGAADEVTKRVFLLRRERGFCVHVCFWCLKNNSK